jgi:hypothetical protein
MATSFSNATIPTKVDIQEPNGTSDLGLEKSRTGALALEAAPDGGARAWLVAAGGSSIFFACLGFSDAFGAFEEYYLTHQLSGQSPGKSHGLDRFWLFSNSRPAWSEVPCLIALAQRFVITVIPQITKQTDIL